MEIKPIILAFIPVLFLSSQMNAHAYYQNGVVVAPATTATAVSGTTAVVGTAPVAGTAAAGAAAATAYDNSHVNHAARYGAAHHANTGLNRVGGVRGVHRAGFHGR